MDHLKKSRTLGSLYTFLAVNLSDEEYHVGCGGICGGAI